MISRRVDDSRRSSPVHDANQPCGPPEASVIRRVGCALRPACPMGSCKGVVQILGALRQKVPDGFPPVFRLIQGKISQTGFLPSIARFLRQTGIRSSLPESGKMLAGRIPTAAGFCAQTDGFRLPRRRSDPGRRALPDTARCPRPATASRGPTPRPDTARSLRKR